jgi:predicted ester cyclase
MAPFWGDNFTYDFSYPFMKTNGLRDWYLGEHLHYSTAFPGFKSTPFLQLGEGDSLASLQSYHTVVWNGTFAGVPAPKHKPLIKIKDLDFYIIKDKKIMYNWCMVDLVAILQQGGYHVLPRAPLPGGINYLPPRAMDGIPSPDSEFVKPGDAERARHVFKQMLQEDFVQQRTAARWWAEDLMWNGPGGVGDARHPKEYVRHFLVPLHMAFPRPKLQIGSLNCEGNYCGALFYLVAKHEGAWLGEQATGHIVTLKLAMHARVDLAKEVEGCGTCGQIADAWLQLDIPEAFMQMGTDLLARAKEQHRHGHSQLSTAWDQEVTAPVVKTSPPTGARIGAIIFCGCAALVLFVCTPTRRRPVMEEPLLA